jgi:GTP-binding protein TypA/BipA
VRKSGRLSQDFEHVSATRCTVSVRDVYDELLSLEDDTEVEDFNSSHMETRNIAIIAHVDHGKTTLTDAIMRQTGAITSDSTATMDSNALEQERGITIYAKNTSITYKGTKINIVDTPGHADFGSEVERVLRSIDSVLLVVDAQEGPMPQTRFVLKKSLELGLNPIVIINKIDKPAADPHRAEEQVLELFLELGANDAQANFTTVYAIGRQGIAKRKLEDESTDLTPLLDTVLEKVPPARGYTEGEALRAQVSVTIISLDDLLLLVSTKVRSRMVKMCFSSMMEKLLAKQR